MSCRIDCRPYMNNPSQVKQPKEARGDEEPCCGKNPPLHQLSKSGNNEAGDPGDDAACVAAVSTSERLVTLERAAATWTYWRHVGDGGFAIGAFEERHRSP